MHAKDQWSGKVEEDLSKSLRKPSEGDEYIHYLDFDDCSLVNTYINTYQTVHFQVQIASRNM